ncbi:uncharacterized protein LACBIDRAFT_301409 [Laccaria bicolor S238N-H82]|uniref:Chromatin modification-related protein n=1 Tax=Laccaria bicolor (strain S238N-H82 / ATCC MYA-4686) TaxID=486041 RepID=B0CNH2_LACBS|nr:uncharacterized protein LACBIDRAFT_301409 [Laccaria bicolor S238N-H82]EDR15927.1 predicted protein [Laccaria bicolor S238N-H82]|eukprot:XP_001874135.1 predicted protein [Laccaria bicolor S238N-H82]
MVPPRLQATDPSAQLTTAHSLALLTEYTHTLDSLPLDLSRNFADLRELDAVLSSSMISITSKIRALTLMIEQGVAPKEDRLWLLTEIAEEANRLKLGGEDKIRVACQAADNLKAHSNHLRTLSEHLPGFDASVLTRKTVYPHVAVRSFMPVASLEPGRRRRGGFGSLLVASNPDPSPAKRKRVAKDEEIDVMKSPKKDRVGDGNVRGRTNGRAKKTERGPSPSESLVSVTSHLPSQATHNARGGSHNATRSNNAASATNKRAARNVNSNRNPTPLAIEQYPSPHETSSRRDAYNAVPSSSSHPSLPLPYQTQTAPNEPANGGHHSHVINAYDMHHAAIVNHHQDWQIPHPQQLEGPGMPVGRSTSIHSAATNVPNIPPEPAVGTDGAATEGGDADADNDDGRTYCFCDGVSYGEMIACDDGNCEREWFHLACIGLAVPPEGRWFCETCKNKRNTKRSGRGGKRRPAGGRSAKGA